MWLHEPSTSPRFLPRRPHDIAIDTEPVGDAVQFDFARQGDAVAPPVDRGVGASQHRPQAVQTPVPIRQD
jgi:hypothetical protein